MSSLSVGNVIFVRIRIAKTWMHTHSSLIEKKSSYLCQKNSHLKLWMKIRYLLMPDELTCQSPIYFTKAVSCSTGNVLICWRSFASRFRNSGMEACEIEPHAEWPCTKIIIWDFSTMGRPHMPWEHKKKKKCGFSQLPSFHLVELYIECNKLTFAMFGVLTQISRAELTPPHKPPVQRLLRASVKLSKCQLGILFCYVTSEMWSLVTAAWVPLSKFYFL